MGQYKLWLELKLQIGFLIEYDKGSCLIIQLPFLEIIFGLTEGANGIYLFKS